MTLKDKILNSDYLTLVVRVFVGVIFIYAAVDKILNPGQFARIVYNYHLLPSELINIFALVLPWVEIACGLLLILGAYRGGAVVIINLITISFIIALAINLVRGVNLECGCFTVSSKVKSSIFGLILRDMGLLVLCIYLYFSRSIRFGLTKS